MSRFGLDLGRCGLKLVRCDKETVTGVERQIDPALGPEERLSALVVALKEAAQELGVRARDQIHVAVPRGAAIVKRLALPAVPPDELEQMIRFQAVKAMPFEMPEPTAGE